MKIWDISRTLADDLAPWPGDTPFHFELTRKIPQGDAVNLGAISMSVHNGSHADAPFHFDAKGKTIDQVALEAYFGSAVVVDLAKIFANTKEFPEIRVDDLQPHSADIEKAARLLLKTGAWRDSTIFPEHIPVIAPDVAEWLQARGIRLLGLDLPSVDPIDAKVLRNHHALNRAGIAIVESLDLSAVESGIYNFMALPLKIASSDGAPVRAVLWRE
ncbi:MAG TPA: cyclase family protein [Chthoniobacterales bacterium]|nr:cyclase family protein [Chthoniobacterales bacterium]